MLKAMLQRSEIDSTGVAERLLATETLGKQEGTGSLCEDEGWSMHVDLQVLD